MGGLLVWPLLAHDTDLYYHLSGGRYILQHRAVPDDTYFSFLSPRLYLDYYWLFQVAVYAIQRLSGFAGLLALRAAAFAATVGLAARLLLSGKNRNRSWYFCGILALYIVALFPRYMNVRPHMFTYLLIVVFLFIIESRPGWIALLPAAAVVWGNVHGASYPVLLLIAGAYAAEHFLRSRRGSPSPDSQRILAFLGLSMAAVFLTPLGAELVEVPFIPFGYANLVISEYRPLHLSDIGTVTVQGWALLPDAASNLLLGAIALSLIVSLSRREARASHLALLAGGSYLLTKGWRFRYESALLALPLLGAHAPFEPSASFGPFRRPVRLALGALLLGLPFFGVLELLGPRGHYPVSRMNLPEGVTAFLDRVGGGGTVLNDPDFGGYLEWKLYPRYRVAMDMQCTIWFADSSYHEIANAFRDPKFLADALSRYHPDFILANLYKEKSHQAIRRFHDYVPVFYDDAAALYVDRRRRPDLARAYALPVDPYQQPSVPEKADLPSGPSPKPPEFLSRMLAIDPGCLTTRMDSGKFCLLQNDDKGALSHAAAVIGAYPELHYGYLLKGMALAQEGSYEGALAALKIAEKKCLGIDRNVYVHMARLYKSHHRNGDALRALRRADDGLLPYEIWQ